jgi:hypothetical protein
MMQDSAFAMPGFRFLGAREFQIGACARTTCFEIIEG